MTTIAELEEDKKQMEAYIAELEEDKKQMEEHYEELISKMKRQGLEEDDESEEEEEVKCICEDCFLEGRVMVSKKRAEYLKKNEIMEYSCVVCGSYSASALSEEEEEEEDEEDEE